MPATLLPVSLNSANSNHVGILQCACMLAMTRSNTLNITVQRRIIWYASYAITWCPGSGTPVGGTTFFHFHYRSTGMCIAIEDWRMYREVREMFTVSPNKVCGRFYSIKHEFTHKNDKFAFWATLWGVRVTYALHLQLVGKRVHGIDFLFAIIEHFSLALTVQTL